MADEEKRPETPETEAGDAVKPESAQAEEAAKAEGEAKAEAQGTSADAEAPPENQPESITQLTGVMSVSASQNPGDIAGYATGSAEDVESASPIPPTPGISQDSDSAAAGQKPAVRLGEEHAGASVHGAPHEYVPGYNEHALSHTTPVYLLLGVFAALTILTILTVAVTAVDLGSQGNFVVAMVIATIKAAIVMMFFMHMLWDSKFNVLVFSTSFLFVLLFLTLSLADRAEYQQAIDAWETANMVEGG